MNVTRKWRILIPVVFMVIAELFFITKYWTELFTSGSRVPIFRQSVGVTYAILWVLIPLIGGILTTIIFPRILTPLFLKMKSGFWRDYTNFCIPSKPRMLTPKKFGIRTIYMSLLITGIIAILSSYISPYLFSPETGIIGGTPVAYLVLVASVGGLVTPIATGLWSVSWGLEDASLMHSKFPPEDSPELFEIEPVYLKYDSLLKGYAGISSILFVISLILYMSATGTVEELLLVFLVILHVTLLAIPSILVQSRMKVDWLRKGIRTSRSLTEEDFKFLGNESNESP